MKMIKLMILFVLFGLLLSLPVNAEEEKDGEVNISLTAGAKAVAKDDSQGKVKEYDPTEDGVVPVLKANISGYSGNTYFTLFSDFRGDVDNMNHSLSMDFNRIVTQTVSYDSIYHRLDHDHLENIDVVSEARSAAYGEDFNPNDQYHITRSEFNSNTTFRVPGLEWIKIYVDVRNEKRKGEYQARTLSKCSACHVVAKTRSINNNNRDIQIGANFRVGKANFDYSFTDNQFTENKAAPTNDYLLVQHPESKAFVFDARIAYGNNETLEFDAIPDSKKNTHLFRTSIPISENTTVSAQYLNAKVENEYTNLNWQTNSFAGGFSTLIGNKGFFNVRFQHIKIDNDSIYVETPDPVDIGGPYVGYTYEEKYDADFDFLRLSALSRTVLDIDANFRYRFNKQFRTKLGYEFKQIDREYYDVNKTTSHTFKANLQYRPTKKLRLTFDGKIKTIDDPFINLYAATAPLMQTETYPNPFVGVQFYQYQDARMNHLGNSPEDLTEVKGKINWNPTAKFSINGNILVRSEKNDSINDFTNGIDAYWKRNMVQWGVNMWAVLTAKLPFTASYYNYTNNYDSMFSVPVIEGCGAGIIQGMPGSLTDMMGYDIDTQTILANLHYLVSKKLSFHLGFNYSDSCAEIVELALNESQMSFIPGSGSTALDFDNMGEIAEYSKIDMKQMIAELGITFQLNKNWAVNGSFFYYFYDDIAEYLFEDTTGKSYSFFAGFTWSN